MAAAGVFCAAAMFATDPHAEAGAAPSRGLHPPLSFERNQGQSGDVSNCWIARVNGHRVELDATGATLFPEAANLKPVRMEFAGARRDASSRGVDPLPGKTNYFIGRDSSRWLHNLDTYGRVQYRDVCKGVDGRGRSTASPRYANVATGGPLDLRSASRVLREFHQPGRCRPIGHPHGAPILSR
jgi:hypothetical protein